MRTSKFNILYIIGFCLMACLFPIHLLAENGKTFTVVIDAGHGGNDPGAIGRKGREKNINLNVALKLGRMIQDNCSDTRVVYTRKNDVFVPLHRRAEIANNAKADLFISIHTNSVASRKSQVFGAETYTLGLHRTEENLEVAKKENSVILIEDDYKQQYAGFNPNSSESYIIFELLQDKNMKQSVNFAQLIQKQFRASKRVDKGVHQAGFLVLRATSMPSVLVELGYISNPTEEAYLLSSNGTSTLAKSIYQAFLRYKQEQGFNAGKPLSQSFPAEDEPATESASDVLTADLTEESLPPVETVESAAAPVETSTPATKASSRNNRTEKPVFKIQILTSDRVLPARSRQIKGLSPVNHYKENGIVKYTYGEDTDYNHILRLKRTKVDAKFKDAFIIAFKNGKKMNINQAIKEFKQNR